MLKVLIVEDDKLVRKGLISAMPWCDFNMEVAGEAGNGEKALEFLALNAVDIMLVDLEMPVMTGIELMKNTRILYPNLYVVVLTLHQEFEYIQEALRLGAIDYIAKFQLEKERFEEVLGRIHTLILNEKSKAAFADLHEKAIIPFESDTGFVFLSLDENANAEWIFNIKSFNSLKAEELCSGLWLLPDEGDTVNEYIQNELLKCLDDNKKWVVMMLEGIKGENRSVVRRLIRKYYHRRFFYDFIPGKRSYFCQVQTLKHDDLPIGEEDIEHIKEQWLSFKWVYQENEFIRDIAELEKIKLPAMKLLKFLGALENKWNIMFGSIANLGITVPEQINCWHDVLEWLKMLRQATLQAIGKQTYSQEVIECITNAVAIMYNEIDGQLFAVDVARRVNMSRSYFNQCFSVMIGKPFNRYLRMIRINKAREYLIQTEKPIQWIAERTGYMDEKYFSHVFREQTGMLPSEFRQKNVMWTNER